MQLTFGIIISCFCAQKRKSLVILAVGEIRIVVLKNARVFWGCLSAEEKFVAEVIGNFSVTVFVERIMRDRDIYG